MITQERNQWRSFAGGELSPEMYGRADLPRHSIGLSRCYNAVVTPQGALENRAGSRFITPTNNNAPAWLAAFVRQDGQGFLIEFGDATLRIVGGGNLVDDTTGTFTVTGVDIWVEADGSPVTSVVFTTGSSHGFTAGQAIKFQGFTLVNPDQAGINQLAAFMNETWYVHTVLSATTFTITDHWPLTSASMNLGFETGDLSNWTVTYNDGPATHFPPDLLVQVDNTTSPSEGTYYARISDTIPGSEQRHRLVSNTKFAIEAGQEITVSCDVRCFDSPDETRALLMIRWYDTDQNFITQSYMPANATNVSGQVHTIIPPTQPEHRCGTIGLAGPALPGWFTLTATGTAPSGARYFSPALQLNYLQEGAWDIDNFSVEVPAVTWSEFSYSPYFGLVNGGTVALGSNTTPTVLTPTYTWSHIRFAEMAQFVNDLVIAHPLYPTAKLTRVDDNDWTFTGLSFNTALAAPANITATPQGTPGTPAITYTYTVTATNEDGAESDAGAPDTADNTLRTLGNFNVISWDAVSTTFRYNVYKGIGSDSVHGYIGSASAENDFTDDNISPDFLRQPAEVIAAFNAPGDYPGTVCFFEQRMVLAATTNEPQAFWSSGLAAFDYFKASVPPQDDQAFTFELMSRKSAPIRHSLADPELLFFTPSGVQRVVPIDAALFTPTTVASRTASAFGAHELAKPQEAGNAVLYPIERGAHLYELKPADGLTGYESNDLSVIAAHLIDNKDWVQTAFRRSPFPIWFGLRDDGLIIALTYMPEQQVYAWHQHELPGAFIESIAVVPEGKVDSLYVVARRTINETTVRYIERIEPRDFGSNQADAFFVDSGVTYRGTLTSTVTGLDHLEGEEVMVLADGRVAGPYTVFGGGIDIDVLASVIHVGLPYTTEIETLPMAYAQQPGYGLGIMKNVSQIWLRIKQSLGFTAGVTFDDDDQKPLVDDATEELGSVPALRDGPQDITTVGTWKIDSTLCIKQTQPLPLTVASMAVDYVDG